ncbi:hypothetical protein T492DRAFT_122862 [Pavlovales sp. CCMP2436]|nr:hypothetical protein T492DRAFT_122862 [Pavlovales sp. CCMP2436]
MNWKFELSAPARHQRARRGSLHERERVQRRCCPGSACAMVTETQEIRRQRSMRNPQVTQTEPQVMRIARTAKLERYMDRVLTGDHPGGYDLGQISARSKTAVPISVLVRIQIWDGDTPLMPMSIFDNISKNLWIYPDVTKNRGGNDALKNEDMDIIDELHPKLKSSFDKAIAFGRKALGDKTTTQEEGEGEEEEDASPVSSTNPSGEGGGWRFHWNSTTAEESADETGRIPVANARRKGRKARNSNGEKREKRGSRNRRGRQEVAAASQ